MDGRGARPYTNMPHDLPKAYEPGAIEARWAELWVKEKLFSVDTPADNDTRPVFTLLLPPPNVTGRLHMGHMLNQTQMDIIVRWHRMRGFVTLWLPGTDHAGIATQMMVERQLASEGKKRTDLGREKFIERVWEWKQLYGGAIQEQMRRLGASVDWDREYFTMDENLSRAVREVFVRLYEQALIYRGKYIVNWCPRCATAISDLEVKHEEVPGKLWEIRYPVIGSEEFITVATTRPETMLGDTAVAVNAKDERYRSEEHTSELQSQSNLVCRLLLEKKKKVNLSCVLSNLPSLCTCSSDRLAAELCDPMRWVLSFCFLSSRLHCYRFVLDYDMPYSAC